MNSETVEEIDSPNDEYKGTDVSASIPFTPHKLSFQDFKKIVPNAHKYSRKELRKSHRDYLKYAKKKRHEN